MQRSLVFCERRGCRVERGCDAVAAAANPRPGHGRLVEVMRSDGSRQNRASSVASFASTAVAAANPGPSRAGRGVDHVTQFGAMEQRTELVAEDLLRRVDQDRTAARRDGREQLRCEEVLRYGRPRIGHSGHRLPRVHQPVPEPTHAAEVRLHIGPQVGEVARRSATMSSRYGPGGSVEVGGGVGAVVLDEWLTRVPVSLLSKRTSTGHSAVLGRRQLPAPLQNGSAFHALFTAAIEMGSVTPRTPPTRRASLRCGAAGCTSRRGRCGTEHLS